MVARRHIEWKQDRDTIRFMPEGIDYTADDWAASAGHFPLAPCGQEELLLLHRHWMWADQQRVSFDRNLPTAEELRGSVPAILATVGMGFMVVWYGMLWAMIEASTLERTLDIRGAFRADIDGVASTLKPCRHTIMHVPKTNDLFDEWMAKQLTDAQSAVTIRRIHRGFERLFLEEFAGRKSGRGGSA